jgi:two-component system KDP operon response regulator KdpE
MTDRTKEPMSLKNVIVVEDDLLTRELIALSFEITHDGVAVEQFRRAQGVIEQVRDREPDLITIDLGLPDGDGLSLIREIRRFSTIPIIVLSARHDDSTIVSAIRLGADSYLIKPSSIVAIQAHVQAVMRLSERAAHNIGSNSEIVIRERRIDIERSAVQIDGVWESLTKLELNFLTSLCSATGRIVLTEDIKSAVWGNPEIPDSTVKMAVYRLRQKIRDDDRADPVIVNHRNVGYSLAVS